MDPLYNYKSQDAALYADWCSIREDLLDAERYLLRLKELLLAGSTDTVLHTAYFNSAIMSYFKVFEKGNRDTDLSNDILAHIEKLNATELHQVYFGFRNKHVAHANNEKYKVRTTVHLTGHGTKDVQFVGGIGFLKVSPQVDGLKNLESWSRLIRNIIDTIADLNIGIREQKVRDAVAGMTAEQHNKLAPAAVHYRSFQQFSK